MRSLRVIFKRFFFTVSSGALPGRPGAADRRSTEPRLSRLQSEVVLLASRGEWPHLSGLVVRRAEAFDGDLSEDVRLQRLLGQVAVVDDGWMKKSRESHVGVSDGGNGIDCTKSASFNHY